MAWYPKAIRKEVTRHRTLMARYRGIVKHVAVSEAASLFGYFNQDGNATSHFYIRKDGTVEQYVDTKYRAPAQLEGNADMISQETQGGVQNADTEPWTAAQVASMADLDAWIHLTHRDIPLQLMADSRPSTKGVGYHKLGVDPYRVEGGELWSKSYGKICPGGVKISQIPNVITRARAIVAAILGGNTPEEELPLSVAEAILAVVKNIQAAETGRYADYVRRFNAINARLDAAGIVAGERFVQEVEEARQQTAELGKVVTDGFAAADAEDDAEGTLEGARWAQTQDTADAILEAVVPPKA